MLNQTPSSSPNMKKDFSFPCLCLMQFVGIKHEHPAVAVEAAELKQGQLVI